MPFSEQTKEFTLIPLPEDTHRPKKSTSGTPEGCHKIIKLNCT